ncbi:glycosyltransferase [Sorangium sp. So ce1151]|uniref:glycosyltransferase n=1 Tax=Sorangium sp. So ce1151 TaxID=3133332 RepID=UPI003F63D14F
MRYLLATYGSLGDVEPIAALCDALARAGHDVTLFGPPDFADGINATRVVYRPLGRSARDFLKSNANAMFGNPIRGLRAVRAAMVDDTREQFRLLSSAAANADHMLAAGIVYAAPSCAEAAGIPYHHVAFSPDLLASSHQPPMMLPFAGLPPFMTRVLWECQRRFDDWMGRDAINEGRRALGLAPITSVSEHLLEPDHLLLAADPELALVPWDVFLRHPPTGALRRPPPPMVALPPRLASFLDAGPPPIYGGFGSMLDNKPAETARLLADAARAVGRRLVLSSGWAGFDAAAFGEDVLVIGAVPHDLLFPRVAVIVHHGGAGTTATAARAGVPQVIVPHLMDQFAWGHRMHRLGVATAPLPRMRLSAARLATSLETCLNDEAMRGEAARLARRLAARDGVATALAILEASASAKQTRPVGASPDR